MARFAELTKKTLPRAPVLAVEVLSRSGRLVDLNLKRAVYQRMGVPSYWIIDSDGPELTVLELDETGEYREVARVTADDTYTTSQPFAVRLVPGRLLGRLRPG